MSCLHFYTLFKSSLYILMMIFKVLNLIIWILFLVNCPFNLQITRERVPCRAAPCAPVWVVPPLCPVWDLLVGDMPPSAWLHIAPGRQKSRTSGTDIADGDRKHGDERFPLNTVLWLQTASETDDRRTGDQRLTRTRWLWDWMFDSLELKSYHLTCPQVGLQLHFGYEWTTVFTWVD